MKKEHFFLGLSLGLFIILAVIALSVYSVTTSYADVLGRPQLLAPSLPTPTPAPLPPGYSPPDQSGVDAQAPRPDLVVESITVEPANPYVFNEATIKVKIANIGSAGVEATNNFFVDLYMGGPGAPSSGQRGITCPPPSCPTCPPNCSFADSGFRIVNSNLPWGCQGFWIGAPGSRYELAATVVFSEVKSYYLYAQIDTPEGDPSDPSTYFPLGHVIEERENNNIYPTDSSVSVQTKAPQRFTQSTHREFYDNYASSLEVVPAFAVLTDINGVQVESDSALILGLFEEPPVFWGTTQITPSNSAYLNYYNDYNVLGPDSSYYRDVVDARQPDSYSLNSVHIRDQSKPVIATDGVCGSNRVVTVWQDHRHSTANPDIYLRWSDAEVNVGSEVGASEAHMRQDWGITATPPVTHEMRVNDDANPAGAAQRNPAVAVAPNGDVVAVWQDNRSNPTSSSYSDIYLQQYRFQGGGLVEVGSNITVTSEVCPNVAETNPDITVGPDNTFYVVWQSQCTYQSALWAIKSLTRTVTGEISWAAGRYVVDPSGHDRLDPRIDVAPTKWFSVTHVDVSNPDFPIVYGVVLTKTIVAVVWHEDRGWGTGQDVYVTYNDSKLTTSFAEDQKIYPEESADIGDFKKTQDQPVGLVTYTTVDAVIQVPDNTGQLIDVAIPNMEMPAIHVTWRDYRNSAGNDPDPTWAGNDPDIYYAYCPFEPDPAKWLPKLVIRSGQSESVLRHDTADWQAGSGPPKQFDPDIAGFSIPGCEIPYDVMVTWADGRNYNNRNFDIYVWTYGCHSRGSNNYGVNDETKIDGFDPDIFDEYSPGRPPAAYQQQPSIAVSPSPLGSGLCYYYLSWADNRLSPVGANNCDVFFTRSNFSYFANYDVHEYGEDCIPPCQSGGMGAGAFISKIFDSCPGQPVGSSECDTQWFKVDYGGVTPTGSWIAVQTRVGDTVTDVLNSEWWPQTLLWAPQGGCWVPLRGYLGPGCYIEQAGNHWPQARHAQYRVNLWTMCSGESNPPVNSIPVKFPPSPDDIDQTPILYYVTLFYGSASGQGTYGNVYLPIILKNSSP